MLRIGCSQSDITPTLPVLMGGEFLKFECQDLLDPIMASCVVADDGRVRVAIVSCDLGSVSRDMVLSIREQVNSTTGTPTENIFVTGTHNHSGPTVQAASDNPFASADKSSQLDQIRAKIANDIATCVIEAHGSLVPARMGYGRGKFDSGAFNRRFIMSNGRSRMGGGNNLERLKPEGLVDREEQVVWFEDHDGRHLAVMVSYAAHPTNFYGKKTISADFPGFMRNVLQRVLGKDLPVLYLQGACGNICCSDPQNPNFPKVGLENARRIGHGLAGEALRIMAENFVLNGDISVSACNRTIEIPYRDVLPLTIEEAREKWEYYKSRWDEFLLLDIEERGSINSTLRIAGYKCEASGDEAEIAAFALGDVFFVTNPAELFVEYQLDIKERFKGHKVIVTEQTNGRISYVPTKLACALGGYETILTRFKPDAGELIRDTSCELLEKLMG